MANFVATRRSGRHSLAQLSPSLLLPALAIATVALSHLAASAAEAVAAAAPAQSLDDPGLDAGLGLDDDDECAAGAAESAGGGDACSLSALQLRGKKTAPAAAAVAAEDSEEDGDITALDEDSEPCETAEEGDECYDAVRWFISKEFFDEYEAYPYLNVSSPFEDFQAEVNRQNSSTCPPPCAPPAGGAAQCETAPFGSACYLAAAWARSDAIYAHPEWYPELDQGSSSIEEFMAHLHLIDPATCPNAPCLPKYPEYYIPSYLDPESTCPGCAKGPPMQGMAYGPAPLKTRGASLLNDDFMTDITGQLWADWGRGDLALMQDMGVNTMRMYGNDPNATHRTFLDQAMQKGIDVIVGQSDWPFMQSMDACMRKDWYCFDQVYESYVLNLKNGMTINGNSTYHPAVKALILLNEPDLKVHPRSLTCRAVATAFDAVLQAEKDLGVKKNPIAITATVSFALFDGKPPGLGQMVDFYNCLKNPEAAPTHYKPKNDLLKAFHDRWVNSFNTANPAFSVKQLFLDKYAEAFWNDEIKKPVFIGEYHSVHFGVRKDVADMLATTKDPQYPFFMGFNFFEFSVRYDKGGSEEAFGMFAYGDCALSQMNYTGGLYTIWNLLPARDKEGAEMADAVSEAFGGVSANARLGALGAERC